MQKKKSLRQPHKKYQTNTQTPSLIWKKVYSLSFRTTLDAKLRQFQYNILNNTVFTNDKLFRFGLSQSSNCTICNEEPESLEHLLSRCKVSSEFWREVLSWLKEDNNVIESFNEIGLLSEIFEESEDFFCQPCYAFRWMLYLCNEMPWKSAFVERLYCQNRRVYNIELHIARERDKLATHFKKWEKLVAALNTW